MEVITGLTIDDGSVTPQNIYLEVDADKSCYVILPDGSVLISAAGIIGSAIEVPLDYTGVAGSVRLVVPNNTSLVRASYGGYIGTVKINAITGVRAGYNSGVVEIYAPNSTSCRGDYGLNITSFYSPNATLVSFIDCKLTENSIGDFLIAASINNPTEVGASADFSGGTNANKREVAVYMGLISASSPDAAKTATFDSWVASYLPTWTITMNL